MKKVYLVMLLLPFAAFAADADYTLVSKEHCFQPLELIVPSGEKVKLLIEHKDATPEECESHPFNREKVIATALPPFVLVHWSPAAIRFLANSTKQRLKARS